MTPARFSVELLNLLPDGLQFTIKWVIVATAGAAAFVLMRFVATALLFPLRRYVAGGRRYAIQMSLRLLAAYLALDSTMTALALEAPTLLILVAAAGAAVVSLASQAAIGNVIDGLIIRSRGMMQIGDFITIEGVTGKVTDMDMVALHLLTVDNSHVFISWTTVANAVLENETTEKFSPVEAAISATGNISRVNRLLMQVAIQIQERIWEDGGSTDDEIAEAHQRAGLTYPYTVLRASDGVNHEFRVYVLAEDQDDRRLDVIHSSLLSACLTRLVEANVQPKQGDDTQPAERVQPQ